MTNIPGTFLAILGALLFSSCRPSPQPVPSDAKNACGSQPKGAYALDLSSWFAAGSVALDGAVSPARSLEFPDSQDCDFYLWSERMFLWLTSPVGSGGDSGTLVMNSADFFDVSLPDKNGVRRFLPHSPGYVRGCALRVDHLGPLGLPVIVERNSRRILEVLPTLRSPAGKQLVRDEEGNTVEITSAKFGDDARPILLNTIGAEIDGARALFDPSTNPAMVPVLRKYRRYESFDRSTLVEKIIINRRPVYLDLSGRFHRAARGQADARVPIAQNGSPVYYAVTVNNVFALYRTMLGPRAPSGKRFPVSRSDLAAISRFGVAHGWPTLPDSGALALEIESAWVQAEGLVDSSTYIRTTGTVPGFDRSKGDDWVPVGTKTVRLALVGLHVVGSTGSRNPDNPNDGHPEMLWATFEHVRTAPSAAYAYVTTSNAITTVPFRSEGPWVLCASGSAGPFNYARSGLGGLSRTHLVPVNRRTLGPTDVRREMPWGLDEGNAEGNAKIISINSAIRSQLDPEDVRRNYLLTGTTWTRNGESPAGSNVMGSRMLSNTTMETFLQGSNCLDCHQSNTTAVSHVFDVTQPLF
jgi:hypothetical protein